MADAAYHTKMTGPDPVNAASAVLAATDLAKRYGPIHAVRRLGFALYPGEAVALCGENGAGKSTVFRMLAGEAQPDGGGMTLAGAPYRPASAAEAVEAGVSMVHQEFNVLPGVSVAENIFLGRTAAFERFGLIDWKRLHAEAEALLARLGIKVDPRREMRSLSPSTQKMVELARALSTNPRVLLLDEITASLDHDDAETLHRVMDELKATGTAIVYVSHRLQEIFRSCDRVVVMKDGEHVTTRPTATLTEDTLSALMVGRDLPPRERTAASAEARPVVLALDRVSAEGLEDVSFEVRAGEIVTLAGLAGSGADELLEVVFGVRPMRSGAMRLGGDSYRPGSVPDAMQAGVAMVPKERAVEGLIDTHDISFNVGLASLRRHAHGPFIDGAREREATLKAIETFRIKCSGPRAPVRSLSGGNKQKVLLAKWFMTSPRLMLLSNPTRGVDVGVKFEIYSMIDALRRQGNLAILMASEDMVEVIRISDTVVTMRGGRVSGVFRGPDEITETNLINAML